jgi:hypothetical protein
VPVDPSGWRITSGRPGLKVLEQHIDDTARTTRWIRIDEPTLRQFAADGTLLSSHERAELLRKALQYDEIDVVKALLDIGADPNTVYYGTNTPALIRVIALLEQALAKKK